MSLDQLMLWQEESPVNRSACQDNDEARGMTVTSGRLLLPLLRDVGPLGSLSRMCLASSAWHSTSFNLTWKARVTPHKRMYFRLVPSVRPISESASSSWRTPQAHDAKSSATQSGYTMDLTHQVQTWPTPVALDAGSGRINRSLSPNAAERPTLAMMARKGTWPTPTANDSKNATFPPGATNRDSLPGALIRTWPTPTATEDHYRLQGETQQSRSLNALHKGNLNPEWVEALMGFPVGWTALDGPLVHSKRKRNGSRRARSHTN